MNITAKWFGPLSRVEVELDILPPVLVCRGLVLDGAVAHHGAVLIPMSTRKTVALGI